MESITRYGCFRGGTIMLLCRDGKELEPLDDDALEELQEGDLYLYEFLDQLVTASLLLGNKSTSVLVFIFDFTDVDITYLRLSLKEYTPPQPTDLPEVKPYWRKD